MAAAMSSRSHRCRGILRPSACGESDRYALASVATGCMVAFRSSRRRCRSIVCRRVSACALHCSPARKSSERTACLTSRRHGAFDAPPIASARRSANSSIRRNASNCSCCLLYTIPPGVSSCVSRNANGRPFWIGRPLARGVFYFSCRAAVLPRFDQAA